MNLSLTEARYTNLYIFTRTFVTLNDVYQKISKHLYDHLLIKLINETECLL